MIVKQNNHFEEAYINNKDCYENVDNLIKICLNKRALYESDYAEYLFCPDCKKARLLLAFGKEKKYLRTFKDDIHEKNCQHSTDVNKANLKQINDYIKNANPQDIENKLWHLLSRFKKVKIEEKNMNWNKTQNQTFIINNETNNKNIRLYIPQQIIKNDKNIFDYNIIKYYRGEIWVEIERKSVRYDVIIKLYSVNENKKQNFICSLLISKNDSNTSVIANELSNITDGIYQIAFFGQMIHSKHNPPINNLRITNKHFIAIRPISQ